MQKLLIVTAPSGAGKTTLVRHLMSVFPQLAFSVSATTRKRRDHEVDGVDYYFLSTTEFAEKIRQGAFLEWEEVYEGQFYGTLHTEINRLWAEHKIAAFDVDVKGANNIQQAYRKQALSFFIAPPSIAALKSRLLARKSETPQTLQIRLDRAQMEIAWAPKFDFIIVNDDLNVAKQHIEDITRKFVEA